MTGEQFACAMEGKEIPEVNDEDDEPADAGISSAETSVSVVSEPEEEPVPDDYELAEPEDEKTGEEPVPDDYELAEPEDEKAAGDDGDDETVFYAGPDKNKKS